MNLTKCNICDRPNIYMYQVIFAHAFFENKISLCDECYHKMTEYHDYLYKLSKKESKDE